MFVFGNLFHSIAYVLNALLSIYFWIIIIRAILSWVRPDPYNPIVRTICRLVDPLTYKIARIVPTRIGMVDIAPFILLIIVMFLQKFLVGILYDLGAKVR